MTMERTVIAFDVDGTLIDNDDKPRYNVINLLRLLSYQHTRIIVWSGGGQGYAEHWVRKLGLEKYVWACFAKDPDLALDICFDDQPEFKMGKAVVIVR